MNQEGQAWKVHNYIEYIDIQERLMRWNNEGYNNYNGEHRGNTSNHHM